MFALYKPFNAFDRAQKPLRFVCVDGVLNVFAMRNQLKIFNSVIAAIKVFVVYLHFARNWAYKSLPQRAMHADLSVFAVFARRKDSVAVYKVRLNWACGAVAYPRFTVLDVERGRDASPEELSYRAQLRAVGKHGFSLVDLTGAKSFPPRNAANIRKIADFVKAFVAANWFPNLHAVNVNTVYVGGQV